MKVGSYFYALPRWSEFVNKHFPEIVIPKNKKERQKLHKLGDFHKIIYQPYNPKDNGCHPKITDEGWYIISQKRPW